MTFPLAARRAGADVIHVQYSMSPLVGGSGVTTIHDVSFFIGPQWFSRRDGFILRQTVPVAARRARRIIAVSDTDAREIAQFIPAATGKIRTTPNACPPWIMPTPDAKKIVEEKFGLVEPFLLTVGTRWARKNMELAVAAAATTPYPLVVTGKGQWKSGEIGPRGRSVGYVTQAELSALYSAAALYLAPSFHEGFGIPLLEAFRCGCPVLCSPGGALPEVAGNAAIVLPDWDTATWTKAISDALSDSSKLSSLTQAGLARERQFTWESTAERTLDVYREVAHD